MKSSIRKRTYQAIYRLLDRVSPLDCDCGTLCGAACCTCVSDETEGSPALGIYLLPGEEKVFTKKESWRRRLQKSCPSRPSESEPARAVTARCWFIRICWDCSAISRRNS